MRPMNLTGWRRWMWRASVLLRHIGHALTCRCCHCHYDQIAALRGQRDK